MDGRVAGMRGLRAKPQRGLADRYVPELQTVAMAPAVSEERDGRGSLLLRSFVLALGAGAMLLIGLSLLPGIG